MRFKLSTTNLSNNTSKSTKTSKLGYVLFSHCKKAHTEIWHTHQRGVLQKLTQKPILQLHITSLCIFKLVIYANLQYSYEQQW